MLLWVAYVLLLHCCLPVAHLPAKPASPAMCVLCRGCLHQGNLAWQHSIMGGWDQPSLKTKTKRRQVVGCIRADHLKPGGLVQCQNSSGSGGADGACGLKWRGCKCRRPPGKTLKEDGRHGAGCSGPIVQADAQLAQVGEVIEHVLVAHTRARGPKPSVNIAAGAQVGGGGG